MANSASQPQFAVGTETHQLQHVLAGFSVDENQIGPDVTIPMVMPVSGQCMIAVPLGEWPDLGERFQHPDQDGIELGAVSAPLRSRL